ncbi:MAG: hypothetical protein RR806_04770 [Oscillospiraceae bacterium]
MLHYTRKLAKIIEELTMFFFSIEATDISSKIEIENNVATITFSADYNSKYANKFETMTRLLSTPKDEMLEEEYWQLAGSGEDGDTSQLLLIGVMVDSTDIDIDCEKVRIIIKKKI